MLSQLKIQNNTTARCYRASHGQGCHMAFPSFWKLHDGDGAARNRGRHLTHSPGWSRAISLTKRMCKVSEPIRSSVLSCSHSLAQSLAVRTQDTPQASGWASRGPAGGKGPLCQAAADSSDQHPASGEDQPSVAKRLHLKDPSHPDRGALPLLQPCPASRPSPRPRPRPRRLGQAATHWQG